MNFKDFIQNNGKWINNVGHLPPELILEEEGFNLRNYEDRVNIDFISDLSRQIIADGIKVSIFIRFDKKDGQDVVYAVTGHRRLRAVKLAAASGHTIELVPVSPEIIRANDEDRIAEQFSYNSGETFTPLERAAGLARLQQLGWDIERIAKKTGLKSLTITNDLKLNSAPTVVKTAILNDEIAATEAGKVLDEEGEKQGVETITQAIAAAPVGKDGKKKATPRIIRSIQTGEPVTPITRVRKTRTSSSSPVKRRYTHDNCLQLIDTLKKIYQEAKPRFDDNDYDGHNDSTCKHCEYVKTSISNVLESHGILVVSEEVE